MIQILCNTICTTICIARIKGPKNFDLYITERQVRKNSENPVMDKKMKLVLIEEINDGLKLSSIKMLKTKRKLGQKIVVIINGKM